MQAALNFIERITGKELDMPMQLRDWEVTDYGGYSPRISECVKREYWSLVRVQSRLERIKEVFVGVRPRPVDMPQAWIMHLEPGTPI